MSGIGRKMKYSMFPSAHTSLINTYKVDLRLFVTDEAHCISGGHDFRLIIYNWEKQVISAAPTTFYSNSNPKQQDILVQLSWNSELVGYRIDREKFVPDVIATQRNNDKVRVLVDQLQNQGLSLVYCATRKQ